MIKRLNARQFTESDGVGDWRVVWDGEWACAHFRTVSFSRGVRLVEAIGQLAEQSNHHPDVDLRFGGVTVWLSTHEVSGLSVRDVELARGISAAAADCGAPPEPGVVQHVRIAIAAATPAVRPFWAAVLGYAEVGQDELIDPWRRGPSMWFQQMDALGTGRNRLHIDVSLPGDEVQQRIAAAVSAGGRVVSDVHAPDRWTLADPEGNEVDLVVWG